MPNNINQASERVKYTRQFIMSELYYQMPQFLLSGEFFGDKISNNARVLYTLLLNRHRISVKNSWFDKNGDAYVYFKRSEMERQLGLSGKTVSKVMQELKDLFLVEETQQGLNKPNKIYLLSPVFDENNPAPDTASDNEYEGDSVSDR